MPQGCGTWPAFWETSVNDWPNLGEVDIVRHILLFSLLALIVMTFLVLSLFDLSFPREVSYCDLFQVSCSWLIAVYYRVEGVNDVSPNSISLHVGETCTMPSSRTETG